MRVEVIGPEGKQMVEPIEEAEVYICGMPLKSSMVGKEDMEDAEKVLFAFEHGRNMLMGNYEVLKYGKITVMREVRLLPECEEPGKLVDGGFPPLLDFDGESREEEEEENAEAYEICANMKLKVSGDELDKILDRAFDGGIIHWCDMVKIKSQDSFYRCRLWQCECLSETVSRGATILLHCKESDEVWEIDREKLLLGLAKFMESDICRGIDTVDNELRTERIGIYDADKIVQLAIFGEIMYSPKI